MRIGHELRNLNNSIRRYFNFASIGNEAGEITGNQKFIVLHLARHQDRPLYQKDIEQHFNLARSSATSVLNHLEDRGFIQRIEDPNDKRMKQLVLTEHGWKTYSTMKVNSDQLELTLTQGFTQKELALLANFIERMQENVKLKELKKGEQE